MSDIIIKTLNVKNTTKPFEELLEDIKVKDLYYREIVRNLKYGLENDILNMPIFKLNYEKSKKVFTLHRDKWNEIINNAIEYFISTEEYELCAILQKILDYD